MFFAALPGFIIGYNLIKDGPLGGAGMVYATTLGWSLMSYLVIGALVLALRIPSRIALTLTAALAGGIYYWYAGPAIASHFAGAGWWGHGIQLAGIGLVAFWLIRTLGPGARRSPSPHHSSA